MSEEKQPLWRWLVLGCLCTAGVLYVLYAGELAIDKARAMVIDRSSPLYWIFVGVFGAFGVLSLRKAWQRIRGG